MAEQSKIGRPRRDMRNHKYRTLIIVARSVWHDIVLRAASHWWAVLCGREGYRALWPRCEIAMVWREVRQKTRWGPCDLCGTWTHTLDYFEDKRGNPRYAAIGAHENGWYLLCPRCAVGQRRDAT